MGSGRPQVTAVRGAATDFFAAVLHTVQRRSLHLELEQGFVSFRERGKGRFDMNVPALESSDFDFLRSPDAPWMPLVRSFLGASHGGGGRPPPGSRGEAAGDEVKLIHMGVFLSLPGSDTQVWPDSICRTHPQIGSMPPPPPTDIKMNPFLPRDLLWQYECMQRQQVLNNPSPGHCPRPAHTKRFTTRTASTSRPRPSSRRTPSTCSCPSSTSPAR